MLIGLVFGLAALALIVGRMLGLTLADRWRANQAAGVRQQARLKAVETQLAGLKAALRISQAEYLTRQCMQTELRTGSSGQRGW